MSSQQNRNCLKGSAVNSGEINHTVFLSERLSAICYNKDYSDVTLVINGQRKIPGHKVILAACSEYFRALLFGGMKESTQETIEMECPNTESFEILLKYVYTGRLSLSNSKEDVIIDLLGLAHQYLFVELEASISDYLCQSLTIRSCCSVYDCARIYHLKRLMTESAAFIDKIAGSIIEHESFLQLSPQSLKELLSRDSFFLPEVRIFKTVANWINANKDSFNKPTIDDVLSVVRLPLMSLEELITDVRPAKILCPEKILDAIQVKIFPNNDDTSGPPYRGLLRPDKNVAMPKDGAVVLQGEMKAAILDGDTFNYNMETGYTKHIISDTGCNSGIVIKLGTQSIVNNIKMLLWDRDLRSYSYYIETSVNQTAWDRIIDHTQYHCRSWQNLYFDTRVVRYIRLVGTNNTANRIFHVVSFEIMYTDKPVVLENGLISPKRNVCTVDQSACVIEGVSRTRNALIDGKVAGYDWDSGYTCHQLGSGCIIIQLGQPYMMDTMKLLLWDCDDRTYSYFIEVSVNMWDWELIVDKTKENCRSWQYLRFKKRPIVFIRITGTHNSANEVFHCVNFECPAEVEYTVHNNESSSSSSSSSKDMCKTGSETADSEKPIPTSQ